MDAKKSIDNPSIKRNTIHAILERSPDSIIHKNQLPGTTIKTAIKAIMAMTIGL